MTIGKKCFLTAGGMMALLFGLAVSSWLSSGTLASLLNQSVGSTSRKLLAVGEMEVSVERLRTAQRGVILYSILKNPPVVQRSKDLFESSTGKIRELAAQMKPLIATDEERQSVKTIVAQLDVWQPLYEHVVRMSDAGQFDEQLNTVVNQTLATVEPMVKSAAGLQEQLRAVQAAEVKTAEATSSRARWVALVLIGLSLAVGVVVVMVVNQTTGALRNIAARVHEGAKQVAAAAGQVASSSQSMAQASSEQAASLEETSASGQEISAMTRANADHSQAAAESMGDVSRRVGEADRNLDQMVQSMSAINASSERISKINKVIDEIAFQTNILALNAAVEAARAGEAGMGFAVVADEVRNLAQRCAQAARDTAELIDESIARSNDGKAKLDLVAAAVRSVSEGASKVNQLVDELKHGNSEQARGIEQMAGAIQQMERVTQQSAANSEETAAASQQLSAQSQALRHVAAQLSLMAGSDS